MATGRPTSIPRSLCCDRGCEAGGRVQAQSITDRQNVFTLPLSGRDTRPSRGSDDPKVRLAAAKAAAPNHRIGVGDSGSASDPTPTADGSNGGRPSHNRSRCCMYCVGLQAMSAGGHDPEIKPSSGGPTSRISAGHRRLAGVELRGFEPRTFSLRKCADAISAVGLSRCSCCIECSG